MAPSPRALIVDDSEPMRRVLMFTLERHGGFACVGARDGAEALRWLAQGKFDLVVTDLNMPVLDGLKLIGQVRRHATHKDVPIVVVTTESAQEDRDRALALGANAYLTKPLQAKDILETVTPLLRPAP